MLLYPVLASVLVSYGDGGNYFLSMKYIRNVGLVLYFEIINCVNERVEKNFWEKHTDRLAFRSNAQGRLLVASPLIKTFNSYLRFLFIVLVSILLSNLSWSNKNILKFYKRLMSKLKKGASQLLLNSSLATFLRII